VNREESSVVVTSGRSVAVVTWVIACVLVVGAGVATVWSLAGLLIVMRPAGWESAFGRILWGSVSLLPLIAGGGALLVLRRTSLPTPNRIIVTALVMICIGVPIAVVNMVTALL